MRVPRERHERRLRLAQVEELYAPILAACHHVEGLVRVVVDVAYPVRVRLLDGVGLSAQKKTQRESLQCFSTVTDICEQRKLKTKLIFVRPAQMIVVDVAYSVRVRLLVGIGLSAEEKMPKLSLGSSKTR